MLITKDTPAIIVLPYPYGVLNPNAASIHWARRAAIVKKARRIGMDAAMDYTATPTDKLCAEVHIYRPERKRYDLDNTMASLKAYLDGICQRIGTDDKNIIRLVGHMHPHAAQQSWCEIHLSVMPE